LQLPVLVEESTMPSLRFLPAALVAASALTAGCASLEGNYSQLSGARYFQTSLDTYPVSILLVDEKPVLNGGAGAVVDNRSVPQPSNFAMVDPGKHQVKVQGPPGGTGDRGETRTIALDVAPCTRYYLVAVKSNRLASDFTVRVDHQEPVSGCKPA
jgi:hypothetical protein